MAMPLYWLFGGFLKIEDLLGIYHWSEVIQYWQSLQVGVGQEFLDTDLRTR